MDVKTFIIRIRKSFKPKNFMPQQLSETKSRVIYILLFLGLLNLFYGCINSKQISIEYASWLANEDKNLIVHCKDAKYDIQNVKFEPTLLEGEINKVRQSKKTSINLYVTQFTKSDSSSHVIIYYDDIEEVTEGSHNAKKTRWFIGSAIVIVGIGFMFFAGVPLYY